MSLHVQLLEMKKLLHGIDGWLTKTVAYAEARKFDPNTLMQARLAPDMFPLMRQIQATCDAAKYGAARSTGKEPPSHPDTETTVEEARKRVATVVSYLDGFTANDFNGAEDRKISLPRWEGKSMNGRDYFVEHAQANFFFHLTMTYAILRHNGVDIGKRDYLGALSLR
ncbi:MAG TPA: DUF1993 domain-containing protein [Kofleriaceae bacterium]|jgi:hypothetical protein